MKYIIFGRQTRQIHNNKHLTSCQVMERVYSYNPGIHKGPLTSWLSCSIHSQTLHTLGTDQTPQTHTER